MAPNIEGRTLFEWGNMLWRDPESSDYKSAVATLSAHLDSVIPAAIVWTRIQESLPRKVFFSTAVISQGKDFTNYGWEAHGYCMLGEDILGQVASGRPDSRATLERIAHDPQLLGFECEKAATLLALPPKIGHTSPTVLSRYRLPKMTHLQQRTTTQSGRNISSETMIGSESDIHNSAIQGVGRDDADAPREGGGGVYCANQIPLTVPVSLPDAPNQIIAVRFAEGDKWIEKRFPIDHIPWKVRQVLSIMNVFQTTMPIVFDRLTFIKGEP